ncbi:MAG: hypothetical protein ABGX00_15230 [Allomuricauda sp.]
MKTLTITFLDFVTFYLKRRPIINTIAMETNCHDDTHFEPYCEAERPYILPLINNN